MDTSIKNIPVLLIIFNRPEKVRELIAALSHIQPKHIYVAADGARKHKKGEKELCTEARDIAQNISWPCSIETRFSDTNQGCKIGVSSAITWFFSHVPEGIILEDDCIPSPSFFAFSKDTLARYRSDKQIMHINGTTFLDSTETETPADSYHFSRIPHVWGWATWKRAWNLFDVDMKGLDSLETDFLHGNYWKSLWKHVRDKKIDTWDAQWAYSIIANKGLSLTPSINLIENIGFDASATHTKTRNVFARKAGTLDTPYIHPTVVTVDEIADENLMKKVYIRTFWQKIIGMFG